MNIPQATRPLFASFAACIAMLASGGALAHDAAQAAEELRPAQTVTIPMETGRLPANAYAEAGPRAIATTLRPDAADAEAERPGVLHYHPRVGHNTGYWHAAH